MSAIQSALITAITILVQMKVQDPVLTVIAIVNSGRMETEDKDTELVEQAFAYLTSAMYPVDCTENRKRVIRKKAKKFMQRDGEFYYKQQVQNKVSIHKPCIDLLVPLVSYDIIYV